MSSKIDIFRVINGHLSTLVNAKTSKKSWIDFITFYGLPLFFAILSAYFCIDFTDQATNVLVTAGAIFTGLLLNLLILVYDLKGKLPEVNVDSEDSKKIQSRHTALTELYFNISYSTLMSLFLVVISIIHLFIIDKNVVNFINGTTFDLSHFTTSPLLVFISTNLFLTILMIIKRIHILLSTEKS